jgi:hypothetical protein
MLNDKIEKTKIQLKKRQKNPELTYQTRVTSHETEISKPNVE